jgi:hypothetical protein
VVFPGDAGHPDRPPRHLGAILVLLTIDVLGRGWRAWWQMMLDWLPFQAVLLAYDYSRGFASPYSDGPGEGQATRSSTSTTTSAPAARLVPDPRRPLGSGSASAWAEMPTTWVQEHLPPGRVDSPWYACCSAWSTAATSW